MRRISAQTAKKEFKKGTKIFILPSRIILGNKFITPFELRSEQDWDLQINAYKYYNCNNETGLGLSYYIIEEELR